ncbi:LacI family DNA-binding transcriptional regulator [Lachnospiraceae bacterium 54-53]
MAGTIREIAELAGVSRGTVDRALNKRGRVNPEVAERIFQIAEEMGYVPKKVKSAAKNRPVRLGVVTQLARASFMIPIKKGIEDAGKELKMRDMELVLEECTTVSEEEQLAALDRLEKKGVSGIAVMPVECDRIRDRLNGLMEQGIWVVTFNSDIVGTKRNSFVGQDNQKSGRTAAGLMGMLTGGQGKILAITGYFGNSVNSMRVDGFVDEIKRTFPGLELVGVQSSFDESGEVEKIIVNALTVFPDLQGIVVFSGGQAGVKRAFEKLDPVKRPHVIIYDLTRGNVRALEEGDADFLIDQDGYTQGYRSLFILADLIQGNRKAEQEFYFTDIIIKTKYNL